MTRIHAIWKYLRRIAGIELGPLLALGLAALALLGFLEIADAIKDGESRRFDEMVMRALRNPADLADPIGPWWLENAFRDLTALGGTVVLTLITMAAIGYLLIERERGTALLLAVSIGGGTVLSTLLKGFFARPRPELVAHLMEERTLSFPSGHAMISAVVFLTLGVLLARVQPRRSLKIYFLGIAVLLTLLVGTSRVYLGVHWPTDVVAGWCIGTAWAMLCWTLALWLRGRGAGMGGRTLASEAASPP